MLSKVYCCEILNSMYQLQNYFFMITIFAYIGSIKRNIIATITMFVQILKVWNDIRSSIVLKQISRVFTHQFTSINIKLFLNMTTDVKWYYLTCLKYIHTFLFLLLAYFYGYPVSILSSYIFPIFYIVFPFYFLLEWATWNIQILSFDVVLKYIFHMTYLLLSVRDSLHICKW